MKDAALAVARFGAALREAGAPVTLKDEIDAARALELVDAADRDETRLALRIALKIPRPLFDSYERLFQAFWRGELPRVEPHAPSRSRRDASALPRGGARRWDPDARAFSDAPQPTPEGEQPGYSHDASLRRRSFDELRPSPAELAAMQRLFERLARRLATRRSRRLAPTAGRGSADLRRSLRRALATGGELFRLARRARKADAPKLVFLCDTSGSMQTHARFLLTFVVALGRALPGTEAFAFNTELVRLTPLLSRPDLALTLARLEAGVPDWAGGTRIGECLAAFADGMPAFRVNGSTIVVVLSDGLDRGDPELFADAVRRVRRRVKRLVWLNPLLGDDRYEPATPGMRAALPYIDRFAPAHNLESLERLLSELES